MPDKPLRLLLAVGETSGGIGRHVAVLAEHLGRHGIAAAVCGPPSALDVVGDIPGVGTAVLPISSSRPDIATRTRHEMRRLARGFDVVHAHGLRAGAIAAARPRGVPLVVTWHNAPLMTGPGRLAHRFLERYVARSADLTLGASPDLVAAARQAGAREARDTFVVAPPLPAPARNRDELRAELGGSERPLVLAVGRLQAQKRFDVLVDAAATWAGDPAGPKVVIAGSGPDEAALRAQIAGSGAPVTLLGARADIADLLAAADVVALPSMWEARSLVAQEAMRAGVPLVWTPVGGLPDLIGDAGIMVPVGDATALADALRRVVAEPGLGSLVAEPARTLAATWPTVDESAADLAAMYRQIAGHAERS